VLLGWIDLMFRSFTCEEVLERTPVRLVEFITDYRSPPFVDHLPPTIR